MNSVVSNRARPHGRKRLNVWVPMPVHDALVRWLGERDQTIQGTVRRLLEAEIEYEGPPEEVRVETRVPVGFSPLEPIRAARPEPIGMTPAQADARYLEYRALGWDAGKSRRALTHTPVGWAPPDYEGDPAPDPAVAKRVYKTWTVGQHFEYWVRQGEGRQSAWERSGGEGDPPEVMPEWVEAGRRKLAGEL